MTPKGGDTSRTSLLPVSQQVSEETPLQVSHEHHQPWPCALTTIQALWLTALGFGVFGVFELLASIIGESLSMQTDAIAMLVDASTYFLNIVAEYRHAAAWRRGAVLWSAAALLGSNVYITIGSVGSTWPNVFSAQWRPTPLSRGLPRCRG